jgi:hypothetical protein
MDAAARRNCHSTYLVPLAAKKKCNESVVCSPGLQCCQNEIRSSRSPLAMAVCLHIGRAGLP